MYEAMDSSEDARFATLRAEFPDAAPAELLRFCRARPNSAEDAAEMYRGHLQWRLGQGSNDKLSEASRAIPTKYIRQAGTALDGTPIIFVQGARYDEDIDPETYMQACAHMLDTILPPEAEGKVTVLIDARPGEDPGFHNLGAHHMLPFFRLCCSVLPDNFPERLQHIVIYPVPGLVKHLWWVVRNLLDPVTRAKFEVLSGSAALGSPCPAELNEIVSVDQLPLDAQKSHQSLSAP